MVRSDYVPVTGDDWYQRRREDAEGEFFRKVAGQGPRKGEGGATRQGIYLFTAGGKLLAYKNAGQAPAVMREVLKQGLREWNKLPAAERRPGAVRLESLPKEDPHYTRHLPPGSLVVDVFTRILDSDPKSGLCRGACMVAGGDKAARDHLWLTEADWKGLIPAHARKGDHFPMPPALAQRISRYHLVDNTRGEPSMWQPKEVRSCTMTLTVEEATAVSLRLRLDGAVVLATGAELDRAKRGFQARLLGYIHYNGLQKAIEHFDLVAVGDHWGAGHFTGNARPGRTPLGIAFTLASRDSLAQQIPPQGARDLGEYLGKEN